MEFHPDHLSQSDRNDRDFLQIVPANVSRRIHTLPKRYFLEINYPQKFQTSLEKIPIFNFTKNGADFHDFFIKIEIT